MAAPEVPGLLLLRRPSFPVPHAALAAEGRRWEVRLVSHEHHSETPSPLRALIGMRSTPGFTASRLRRKASMLKSRWGSRSVLLISTSSTDRNMSGYFSG